MTEILHIFANLEDGIESRVALLNDGRYSVTLRDIDADMVVDCARIYADESDAIFYAETLI